MPRFFLPDLAATERFGRALAQALEHANPGALLLYGDLGVGKTTLTSALVKSLPGGGAAETASPSFTICNIYCTQPLVHHFDLYRTAPGSMEEALEESLDHSGVLTVVEWPERLAKKDLPEDGLVCRIGHEAGADVRTVDCAALGERGITFLNIVASLFAPDA